jgi:hypothetical protein
VKQVMAEKSKFIRPEEFEGVGKVLDILNVDTEANGKYGPSVQFAVKEPKSNRERIWNCSSFRALKAVEPLLEIGNTLLRVWTTGIGTEKLYHAEAVGSDVSSTGSARKGSVRKRR